MSGAFVIAAAVAGGLSLASGGTTWAAIHLALAGAATVAIGTFMPHFAITLAGTRPSPVPQRLATVVLLAAGGAAVVAGVLSSAPRLSSIGTVLSLAGLVGVAIHTAAPLRQPLARRHPIVSATYGLALAELFVGLLLGGLAAAGVDAVVDAWDRIRPAHAWLTLFGGVTLTILATLVYLAPTVLGARIRPGWGLAVAVVGLGLGPPISASAFVLDSRMLAVAGSLAVLVGAIGQIAYVLDCLRRRGRYTSEHDWRGVAVGHLLAGPPWLAAAAAVAFAEIAAGRPLSGWSLGVLAVPMIGGWMAQELVGSWTHLVPSVTPGTPTVHARQRRLLAVAARTRLVAWNLGVGLIWVGAVAQVAPLVAGGAALLGGALVISVVALARALTAARY